MFCGIGYVFLLQLKEIFNILVKQENERIEIYLKLPKILQSCVSGPVDTPLANRNNSPLRHYKWQRTHFDSLGDWNEKMFK